MHHAWLSKTIDEKEGTVQCLACSNYCKILKGKTGICSVRKNTDGKLDLLVYGKVAAQNIDPIEKKPLFHFMPGTEIYSIGTVGCNFRCPFCQNWDISQISKPPYNQIFGDTLPPKEIVDYCLNHNIPSIAYTYNEPTIFFEFAYDTAKLGHENGLKNVFVSNGYLTEEALDKISLYLDAINIDLKAFTEKFYNWLGGKLQPVLDGIKRTYEHGIWMEITTLLIPGKNDSDEEVRNIAEFIAGIDTKIPWHISRFHPDYKVTDKAPTSMESLEKAYKIGKDAGLQYVYLGNVESDKENTYCPKCNELIIRRNWYSIETHYTKKGECPKCKEAIPLVL